MLHLLATAAMAAVLCGDTVALVQADPPAVVRRYALPGPGIALFAAPDGKVIAPLTTSDATVVLDVDGSAQSWDGRLFPLFFDEADRMLVVFPGTLATLSYPERVVIERLPVKGLDGVWRAACSRDGRLVAVVPAGNRSSLVISGSRRGGPELQSALPAAAEVVVAAPDAGFAVAGLVDGSLDLVVPGGPSWVGPAGAPGRVTSLAISVDGRDLLAAVAGTDGGAVADHRVDVGGKEPLRLRRVTSLGDPVTGLALADDDTLFVLTHRGVAVYVRRGRKLVGAVELAGGSEIVPLPGVAKSLTPDWSED